MKNEKLSHKGTSFFAVLQIKSKSLPKIFSPILVLFLVWVTFSAPYFFQNKVPYPSKYQVTFFAPWSHYEQWWGPVKNNAMPDVIDQIYPWKYFTIKTYRQGQIPYWNPNNFAGNPHLANFQSAVFSPFNLLYFILPFIDAWSITVLLQPLLAGLFTYLLLRELKVSQFGALISSATYMFCGFIVVWMAYGTLSLAIAFLPLAIFAIERFLNTKKRLWLFILPLAITLSLFSGHFQTSLYLLLYTAFYGIVLSYDKKNPRFLWPVVLFFIFGLLLSLPQILPSIAFYAYASRSQIYIQGGGIPWHYLVTMVAPDFYGNPVTRNDWFGTYAEWSSFIGIIPLLFAFFALSYKRKKHVLFFFVAGLVSLLLASDTPLTGVLSALHIPVLSTSNPPRIIVLFSFSFAVLAGFGFDVALHALSERQYRKLLPALLGVGVGIVVIWGVLFGIHPFAADKLSIAKRNFVVPTLWFAIVVFSLTLAYHIQKKIIYFAVGILIILIVFLDSFRFAQKWMPFDDRALVFPSVPVLSAIQQNIGYGRIFGNLGTQVETYYGFPSIEGYDPLYIERYGEFVNGAHDGTYSPAERSVAKIDRNGKFTDRVLDLLSVSLFFHPLPDTNQTWAYPVWGKGEKYTRVYQDDKFALFRNNTALPRAALFHQFEVITDKKAMLRRFYTESFDFRNILLLEEKPPEEIQSILESDAKKEYAHITSYTPDRIMINVHTRTPALLFMADNYYPNWLVLVDGKSARIFRSDYTFRSVVVPKGDSTVEFYYRGII